MRKHLWASATVALGLSLSAFGAPAGNAKFNATVKNVDMGGEMFMYEDMSFYSSMFNDKLPKVLNILFKDQQFGPTVDAAAQSLIKLFNLPAFKSIAASSIKTASGVYCYKSFTLADMQAKSIFIDPSWKNVRLDWQKLPSDTRIAMKCQIDLGHVWQMVYAEAAASADQQIKSLAIMADSLKQQGIDLNALMNSVDGDLELLVTGTGPENVAAKLVFPDKNGAVAALLKGFIPPQPNSNAAMIPTPFGNIQVIYETGKIIAVTKPQLLQKPAQTLIANPLYKKYAALLPATGTSYIVVDIPQEVLNLIKANVNDPQFSEIFDLLVKPFSMVCAFSVQADGAKNVIASNFSIANIAGLSRASSGMLPSLGMRLPALSQARQRAYQASCVNNMKQFGVACLMFANDFNDKLPDSLEQVTEKKYIDENVCEDIIYLGKGMQLNKIAKPATTPLAICDRCSHKENQVCVLYADGHVESVAVPESADDEEVLQIIGTKAGMSAEEIAAMQKLLNEDAE
ncbi:MAG: DUF1559 domain-containing protein [Lentisphaerae bacterium]|nr:DUF1559 domain-containing protein [Lentisphaerota bacterium]